MTAMTVIAAMLPLLQSVHLSYSSLSEACRYLPDGRLLALFRCPFCSLSIPCGFVWNLTVEPRQTREIILTYSVKYPRKEKVILE